MFNRILHRPSDRRALWLLGAVILAAAIASSIGLSHRRTGVEGKPASVSQATPSDSRPVLRVAVAAMISPQITAQYYQDMLNLIGDRVGRRVEFVQRKTYKEVNDLLEQRKIDLAFVCSGPYVLGHEKFGMEILAVPVSHGQRVYHSYFIVHRDSPARSLDDLRGKTFAFTDPASNTGCIVPKYVLAERGETPESFFRSAFFTNSHDNSVKAVAEQLADGAAVDSLIWDFMHTANLDRVRETKVIAKSPPYGMPPLVVHPRLDEGFKRQLRDAVMTLHKRADSRRVLRQLQIDRFVEGDDSAYDSVRAMQRRLSTQKRPHP